MMKFILYYNILIFIPTIFALNLCEQQKTCEKCIRHSDQLCVWCSQDNLTGPRCMSKNIQNNWCEDHTVDPESKTGVVEIGEFSSAKGNVIQIIPQKMNIDIRPGDAVNFNFSFKRADNYPVDLYFLFDESLTMKDMKNKTKTQINDIYNYMLTMTEDINIGTGSFVDKNALPYTDHKNSTQTYSFINRVQLGKDVDRFKKIIDDTKFGYNVDPPEGTLDALAQVIVCKEQIGWRNESTKIVIVLTDARYHVAGDGKWAGITRPYDGTCSMKNNKYSKELEMDYPSISIINHLVSQEEIIVLFIVKQEMRNNYVNLRKHVTGSISKDYGGDMTKILKNVYKQILRDLKIKVNFDSFKDNFKISFNKCYTKKCIVEEHEKKNITGKLELPKYFESNKNIEFEVAFEGIKESLKINVNVLKNCNCTQEEKSSKCSSKGTLRCGICECNDDSLDEKCNKKTTCIAPGTNVTCSRHGYCARDKCICTEGYEGKYCECKKCAADVTRCECECGVCTCQPGWTGDLCNCPETPDCFPANDIKREFKCSNRGRCDCISCDCEGLADWDARTKQDKYCNVSCAEESCHNRQCLNLDSLVLQYLKDSSSFESTFIYEEKNLTSLNESWYACPKIRVDVACYTQYAYQYSEDVYGIKIIIQSDWNCAATYYGIGGACLGLLILIGIVTLIAWKYINKKRDAREYERLLKAINDASTQNNDLYVPPSTTFNNPVFRKRSITRSTSNT